MNQAARIISIIFHPLLMATYGVLLFALFMPVGLEPFREEHHLKLVLLIFIVTFFLPFTIIGLMRTMGLIPSIVMVNRRERLIPFVFLTCWHILITYLLYSQYRITLHDNLMRFVIVMDVLILVSTVVTFFYKVSVHSIAMWGMVGLMIALTTIQEDGALLYPLLITVVLSGVVMSARLQLNAHSFKEVIAGSAIGLIVSMSTSLILF